MAYYLEVPLDAENTILVDVTTSVEGTVQAGPGEVVGRMSQTLERALDRLEPLAATVVRRLATLPRQPDRASIEFGISLTAKTGVVIAESTGQSHFNITLEWQSPAGTMSPSAP